jgi:RHS repeat-associated protein
VNAATTNYALDLNAGLTQVLSDGSNTYLYGAMRIGELQAGGMAYHLGDALGSVRQLVDASGNVTLARNYEPYGTTLSSAGTGNSVFQFTGEQRDTATGFTFLRARYYNGTVGRFFQHDPWKGDHLRPQSFNPYGYVGNNVVSMTDPTGRCYPPLEWLRKVPPDDLLCKYMDAAAFVWGAPMAKPEEKALAATYIGLWATAHSLLLVGSVFYAAGTAVAAVELIPAVSAWASTSFTSASAFGTGTSLLTYQVATSQLANAIAVGGEAYLAYRGAFCKDQDAAAILFTAYNITGSSALVSTATSGINKLALNTGVANTTAQLRPIIGKVIQAKTPGEVESILDANGIQYEVDFSMWKVQKGGLPEPTYKLSGFGKSIEIRLHLNSDATIHQFRIGVQVVQPAFPRYPQEGQLWRPDTKDVPLLLQADQTLIEGFGTPIQNPRFNPEPGSGKWSAQYLDPLGWAYLDRNGNLIGLRSDAGHITRGP